MNISEYNLQKAMRTVPVPTLDIDVMKMLRQLKQPICLFGEDPPDRKERLRRLLAQGMAADLQTAEEQPEFIPRIEEGPEEIIELKKHFINFSIPRSQRRIQAERAIDQSLIDETNKNGQIFESYTGVASQLVDSRPLTALSTSEDFLAITSLSGQVSLWSISTMSLISSVTIHTDRVTCCAFANDHLLATGGMDSKLALFPIYSKEEEAQSEISHEIQVHPLSQCIQTMAPHPDGSHLLLGHISGEFSIFDIEYGKTVVSMKSQDGTVSTIACHPDGGLIATGGTDFVGRLWDLRSCKPVKVMLGHTSRLTCSTFDSEFHFITGSVDNTIIVWDLRNLSRSKRISGHLSGITSVSTYNNILLTSSLDQTIKIWSLLDFRLYKEFIRLPSPVMDCTFSNNPYGDGPLIISVSKDGSWRYYSESLI